jgi:NAD(P)-dependent dehydrogenase (short-subunit alcohol dehydrogenase family)
MIHNIAIIGSSGAIGNAFVMRISKMHPKATIHAFSRGQSAAVADNILHHKIDYTCEHSLKAAADIATQNSALDMVIVTTGILHSNDVKPEKSLQELSGEQLMLIFKVNTITPALIAKYFLPKLNTENKSIFAALSARVGSISDNKLGGWYAYRSSKAALNMIIKNAAIEVGRRNKKAIIVGLHPGTVDSDLSKPFQKNVPDGKLLTPDHSVEALLEVLDHLTPESSGKCFAWDGGEIKP